MIETITKSQTLQIADKAPEFIALDQNGNKVSLKQFSGKTIVIYFYLKDNEPDCTKQAQSFRDRYSSFKNKNIIVIGVSKDSQKSHNSFSEKLDLPFILITDKDKKIMNSYGVCQEKIVHGKKTTDIKRTTFIINPDQKVSYITSKITCENHAEEVLEKLEELKLI